MKICFYAPCNVFNRWTGPLMGIAYMAAYLEEQLGLTDFAVEVSPERVLAHKPDLIGISAFTEKYNHAIAAAQLFKQERPEVPVIIGGPHISALPESLHPSMDVGVVGEGEIAMKQLVEILLRGDTFRPETLRGLKNMVYRNAEGQIEQSTCQERIQDLDIIPVPRRDIMRAWWPEFGEEVVWEQGIYTSRGCPFTCRFCMFSQRGNLVRYRSVDRVIEELMQLVRQNPQQKFVFCYDDLFVTKKSRLKEIADGIRSEKLHKRLTFACMAKSSFFDEEFVLILKSMNVKVLSFGFESGSDPILHFLKDRHSTVAKHQQSIDLCYKHGIHVGGYIIIGSPPETQRDLARTYWFLWRNKPKMPEVAIFPILPLPGTQLWTDTVERGLIDASYKRWENMGYLKLDDEHYIHLNEHYSLDEMKAAYDHYFEPFMNRYTQINMVDQNRLPFLRKYYQQVAQDIRSAFPAGAKLLEINRGENQLLFDLESDYDITSLHWSRLDEIPTGAGFDGIILTHVLEKTAFSPSCWSRLQQFDCPVYLLFENAASMPRMFELLRGAIHSDMNELGRYEQRYHFSLATAAAGLGHQAYRLIQAQRYTFRGLTGQSVQMQQIVRLLSQFMDMARFSQEADVYSYGLWLERLPQRIGLEAAAGEQPVAAQA